MINTRFDGLELRNIETRSGPSRTDEVMIGSFSMKPKQRAFAMVEKIIRGQPGSPSIIKEKVSNVPTVVPVRFSSAEYAQQFIESHGRSDTSFEGYFEDFWCNYSQTEAQRAEFRQKLQPLFKVKRALMEIKYDKYSI